MAMKRVNIPKWFWKKPENECWFLYIRRTSVLLKHYVTDRRTQLLVLTCGYAAIYVSTIILMKLYFQ